MATQEYSDQALRKFLAQQSPETLPENFHSDMMERIRRTQKARQQRNLWFIWSAVGMASMSCILLMIFTLRYLSINLLQLFKETFKIAEGDSLGWSFYIYIGIATLLLLAIDLKFRKMLLK